MWYVLGVVFGVASRAASLLDLLCYNLQWVVRDPSGMYDLHSRHFMRFVFSVRWRN